MTTPELPRFLVLQSVYNKKYLRYLHEAGPVQKFLEFSADKALDPYTKYEMEKAKNTKGLVHIKCCYNSRYWVRSSQTENWIVAGADEPEEDISKWTCTLFEPIFIDGKRLRFRHVQLGHYAGLWKGAPPHVSCLVGGAATVSNDQSDVYTIIDWESYMVLPKYVAFKGDNGKYLVTSMGNGNQFLQYYSKDTENPKAYNEVFTTSDGSIRIKSTEVNRFWRRNPNWIWADSSDSTANNSDTLFWPIQIEKNVVALRNKGNNQFCKKHMIGTPANNISDCLSAATSTVTREAKMEVEELIVISRNIYYIDFRLMDAKVYDQSVLTMATGTAVNKTQESNTIDVKLSYTNTKSSSWNSSVTLKLVGYTRMESDIPLIVDGSIETSDYFNGTYEWGRTEVSTNVVDVVYTVVAAPMSKVTVNLLATKGSCNVPFTYTQADTLHNGENTTYEMDDGVYTGINCYNFKYEIKQEPL